MTDNALMRDDESGRVDAVPGAAGSGLDDRTARALAALMAISPSDAADVRERSPARRRPHGRYGPSLDLGVAHDGRDTGVDGSGGAG